MRANAGLWAGSLTDYIYSKPEEKTKPPALPPFVSLGSVSFGPDHFIVRLSSAPGFQSLPLAVVRTAPRNSRSLGTPLASR
jgi:hypothetical protein